MIHAHTLPKKKKAFGNWPQQHQTAKFYINLSIPFPHLFCACEQIMTRDLDKA